VLSTEQILAPVAMAELDVFTEHGKLNRENFPMIALVRNSPTIRIQLDFPRPAKPLFALSGCGCLR
jgi:hypothetical protein